MALSLNSTSTYRTRSSRRKSRLMSEINVTPFVDVMLVLLIIFMVTAPLLTTGVQVELPKTSADSIAGDDEPIAVTLTKKGEIYIQESKIKLGDLAAKLKAITGEKPDTRIFVRSDFGIPYGKVMEVVGAIYEAGFSKIAFVTEQQEEKGR